ncbi:MAG: hypothetical protein ABSC48_02220 [Terracidiphilus sp.]|jgi:hypothetical protein
MNVLKIASALSLLLSASLALGQGSATGQAPSASKAVIPGVWRGEMDNLPIVTLVVSDEGSGLTGAALFYMLRRFTVNDPFTASPGLPEPLLNPTFDGKTLYFQISHRRAHPPGSLSDPPCRFHMTLTGPDKAEFVNDCEKQPRGLAVVRSEY